VITGQSSLAMTQRRRRIRFALAAMFQSLGGFRLTSRLARANEVLERSTNSPPRSPVPGIAGEHGDECGMRQASVSLSHDPLRKPY
jgi:hypothetical protein